MVFKALFMGRIANQALSRTIKEWYAATRLTSRRLSLSRSCAI